MEMNISDWSRDDLSEIHRTWLDYCQNVARSDMHIRPDAAALDDTLARV